MIMVANKTMGKKNKNRDIWDLSPEEQSKKTDDIFAIENGAINIKPEKGVNSRGFSCGLENAITKDILGKKENVVSLNDKQNNAYDKKNKEETINIKPEKPKTVEKAEPISIDEPDEVISIPVNINNFKHTPSVEQNASITTARSITFNVIDILDRLVVDDGVAPTSFSFDIGLSQELVNTYDTDEIGDMTVDLFSYIISLKHPTAIYEYDDFVNRDFWKFGSVSRDNYNHNRYMFLTANGYVFCYLLDEASIDGFYNFINDSDLDKHDILRIFVSLSYAVGTMQQAFFIEDDKYVRTFMYSYLNKQKEFHNIFSDDLSTSLIPNGDDVTEKDGISMLNVQDLQSYVREMIGKITGTSYFGDDDEWENSDDDELDDENDDESYNEDTDGESVESSDEYTYDSNDEDVSDLLSDDMEVVEDDTTPDDDGSNLEGEFVVDVIRKK